MNKYALGAIVGAALLGFAKNSGSKIRLYKRVRRVVRNNVSIQFQSDYPYDNNDVQLVEEYLNSQLPAEFAEFEDFEITHTSVQTYQDDIEFNDDEPYVLDVAVEYEIDPTNYSLPSWKINDLIERYVDSTIPKHHNRIRNASSENKTIETVHNAETGEEYTPKDQRSRLRRA